ncbi:MAG TPA: D-alanyl-D-alanine carboxypeptidase, partial [Pyrinomonadaceae bacterium]|nr:D-alanyl-D-alanine carboxypeptidase [Pyrinomonadaceae bacterium]
LNRRQPIIWMIACGLVLIGVLTTVPHLIKSRAIAEDAAALLAPKVIPAEAEATARPTEAAPSFDAASWYAARGEAPESHGVLVETFGGEQVLASLNADATFNPASLMKLSTSLVALKKLGAGYRFQTTVFVDDEKGGKGSASGARLYVESDDPTFGDAGANLIAKELKARGIERLSEVTVSPEFCFNFSDKPDESAGRLAKALKLGNPKTAVDDEAGATGRQPLLTINSNPLSDVLLYMNARSSNFIAEKIGALIGGAQGVERFLVDELKLPAERVTIATVSGREHNRLTPRDLLTVIRALIAEAHRQGLEPADIMPVASDDAGTLRRRLSGTGLEGAVVAKTGTLTAEVDGGMASLAGLVYTQDRGIILFAIMDQGNRIWDNRQLEDQLLAEVVTTHATPQIVAGPTPRRLLPAANVEKQ